MLKDTKIYSIVTCTCPRCHTGKMFKPGWGLPFWNFGVMQQRCDVCDLNFTPEPGFYFGASYMSYIFGVAISGATWIAMWLLNIDDTIPLLITITSLVLLAAPYNFKISRSSWLNIFVKYKKELSR
jgi:uncharacterized protein (DUF983 family)